MKHRESEYKNLKLKDIPHAVLYLEEPFADEEMTWEEFLEERENFAKHYEEYRKGYYKCLFNGKIIGWHRY